MAQIDFQLMQNYEKAFDELCRTHLKGDISTTTFDLLWNALVSKRDSDSQYEAAVKNILPMMKKTAS